MKLVKSEHADLLTWCRDEERWLRETIETLVRLESPSTDKAAVDRCGDELAAPARSDRRRGRAHSPRRSAAITLRAEFGGGRRRRSCSSGTSIPCGRSGSSSGCRCARRTAGSTGLASST